MARAVVNKKLITVTSKTLNACRNGHHYAVEVLLVEAAPPVYVQGIVCALKESFGFIERADKVNEVCAKFEIQIFRFSSLQGIVQHQ